MQVITCDPYICLKVTHRECLTANALPAHVVYLQNSISQDKCGFIEISTPLQMSTVSDWCYLASGSVRDAGFGFSAVAIDLCTVHLSYSEGASDLHSVLDETTQIICQRLSYCCFPLSGEFGLIPACSQMDVARQHGWGPSLPAVACIGKPTRSREHTYRHTC